MKKILESSLLTAETTALVMLLMLLYFLTPNKPYLSFVLIAVICGAYLVFKLFMHRVKSIPFMVLLTILLGILSAAPVIVLLYVF